MSDAATERMIELQKQLTIRLAELGFEGPAAANIVHRLAEIAVLASDVNTESLPLLIELSPDHRDALVGVVAHIKLDLDEIRDGITDLEHDLSQLLEFLQRR
jgi:hypothetical protein